MSVLKSFSSFFSFLRFFFSRLFVSFRFDFRSRFFLLFCFLFALLLNCEFTCVHVSKSEKEKCAYFMNDCSHQLVDRVGGHHLCAAIAVAVACGLFVCIPIRMTSFFLLFNWPFSLYIPFWWGSNFEGFMNMYITFPSRKRRTHTKEGTHKNHYTQKKKPIGRVNREKWQG